MPVIPRIHSIVFLSPVPGNPDCGGADIRVSLQDGGCSVFSVLTPSHVGPRMNEAGKDFSYGHPALFVRRADRENLGRAVQAMAADMSGFWLRYYNSKPAAKKGGKGRRK